MDKAKQARRNKVNKLPKKGSLYKDLYGDILVPVKMKRKDRFLVFCAKVDKSHARLFTVSAGKEDFFWTTGKFYIYDEADFNEITRMWKSKKIN